MAADDFDLDLTLNCGQVFHWRRAGAGYAGVIGETPVYVEQRGGTFVRSGGTEKLVEPVLRAGSSAAEMYASFPDDPAMNAALATCRGLRIIRQPLWECLASFITSALKQVAHIAQISHLLRERFGRPVGASADGNCSPIRRRAHRRARRSGAARLRPGVPRAERVGNRAALSAAGGVGKLEAFRALDRPAALAAVDGISRRGTKVANCVLLFGYEHLDAFPIDVWIERVLRDAYFPHEPDAPVGKLQRFAEEYFGPYGGYAQQYLFHHARVSGRKQRDPVPDAAGTPIRRVRKRL